MVADVDYAWAAGIIDGEGCIFVERKSKMSRQRAKNDSYILSITIVNTEPSMIYKLKKIFEISTVVISRSPKDLGNKAQFILQIKGKECINVLEKTLPYIINKKPQALVALRFYDIDVEQRRNGTPEHVNKHREEIYNLLKTLKHNTWYNDLVRLQ